MLVAAAGAAWRGQQQLSVWPCAIVSRRKPVGTDN